MDRNSERFVLDIIMFSSVGSMFVLMIVGEVIIPLMRERKKKQWERKKLVCGENDYWCHNNCFHLGHCMCEDEIEEQIENA